MDREALIAAFLDNVYHGHGGRGHGRHRDGRGGCWRILHYLYQRQDAQVFPSDLCQELDVTTPRVTNLLNDLERDGLIQRVALESDRRKVLVTLTEAGLAQIEAHNREQREEIGRILDRVGEENAQIYLDVCQVIREERRGPGGRQK